MGVVNGRVCAAILVLLGLGASPCFADLIRVRQVLPFSFTSMQWRTDTDGLVTPFPVPLHWQARSLHFKPFDPSAGTLRDAYLSYEGQYAISYTVAAGTANVGGCDPGAVVAANAQVNYTFGVNAPGITETQTIHEGDWLTSVSGRRCSGIIYPTAGGTGTIMDPWVHEGDLNSPFLGLSDGLRVTSGFPKALDVTLTKVMTAYMLLSSYTGGTFSNFAMIRNDWSGNVALTYEYETNNPAPVPEPASLLLVGAGLLGLARSVRFRR